MASVSEEYLLQYCLQGDEQALRELIAAGCDPRTVQYYDDRHTPLHIACMWGHLGVVKLLVETHGYKPYNIRCSGNLGDLSAPPHPASTPLLEASRKGNMAVFRYLISDCHCSVNECDSNGNTPLHLACSSGHLDLVKFLMSLRSDPSLPPHRVPDLERDNNDGMTPLCVACHNERWDIAHYLISECHCNASVADGGRDTPLHLACQWAHLETVALLTTQSDCDVNASNWWGDTPLHTACVQGHDDVVKFLMSMRTQQPPLPPHRVPDPEQRNKEEMTPLLLACYYEKWSVAQYLISECHCDVNVCNKLGDTPLHIICRKKNVEMAELLLKHGSDPNQENKAGKVPLDTTDNLILIKELLYYGANSTVVYRKYGSMFSASSHEQPPESQIKVFVVGDAGVGKSTLTEALKQEGSGLIHSLTGRLQNVSGVDQKTAGIVPHDFRSRKYGYVTFYDFAGQKEFYAAHSAVLQNAISSSTPVFVFVTDLRESEENLKQQLLYWLSFLENQYTIEDMKPHIIVVGSHADAVKPSHKLQALESVLTSPQFSSSFHLAGLIAMDCRKAKSPAITTLRRCLRESCNVLREQSAVNFQSHCLLVCLAEFFPTSLAFQLGDILASASDKSSESLENVASFLPDSAVELCTLLEQLNDHGHILLLKNTETVESSWVILDKQALLSHVTGTVFAPEGFKQHCELASSTGVVPYSKVAQRFPEHNPDMIVGFLSHLEFCREISDPEVLQLISEKHQPDTECTHGRFLFFPSLIRIESPSGVWETDPRFHYHCGWMLQCSQPNQFFTPRFLQVLLLRLAFSLALAKDDSEIRHDIPALQRKCKIWRNGICWTNRKGVETLVEVDILYTKLLLMMRCLRGAEMACVHLRSTIIGRALQAKKDFCPKISTYEFVLPPSEVASYPRRTDVPPTLISITEVARAILEPAPFVLDNAEKTWHLEDDLLYFEPYASLGRDHVCELFEEESNKELSEGFLYGIADQVHHKFDQFKKMLDLSPTTFAIYLSLCPPVTDEAQKMVRLLLCWKEHSEGSRQYLRRKIEKFSVFAGRNPLNLAKGQTVHESGHKD